MKKNRFILFVFTTFFISCKKEITIENLMLVAEDDFEHMESHQFNYQMGIGIHRSTKCSCLFKSINNFKTQVIKSQKSVFLQKMEGTDL